MQKIGLPLALFITLSTTVVLGQKDVPLRVQGDSLIVLRAGEVLLSKQGFPQQIWIDAAGEKTAMLAENVHFHFVNQVDGKDFRLKSGEVIYEKKGKHRVAWHATSGSEAVSMYVYGEIQDKGVIALSVRVTALEDVDMKDIVMHVPMEKGVAKSMQGLGRSGDYSFDSVYHWKWPGERAGESGWIGNGSIRLGFGLSGGKTWWNEGKGGIDVGIKGKSMLVNSYSGAHRLRKGETIKYNFNLVI
ncbi:MAG: hypothetical protein JST42_00075 [Bacteroidetes bacterium]|nr:hypothetical protein [Bacteroidota bacterium]